MDVRSAWELVRRDVEATTSLRLRLTRCDGAGGLPRAFVAWRDGEAAPALPIETQWMDEDLSYVVIADEGDDDVFPFTGGGLVAGVQDLVQMSLYAAGVDPTWPRCPDHGTHPMAVTTWFGNPSRRLHLEWCCPSATREAVLAGEEWLTDAVRIPVGSLTRPERPGIAG